jgi:uncharacterized protein HemX
MVDVVSLLVAIAGLTTAAVGVAGYLSQRAQLKVARSQLAADGKKIEALGNLVTRLDGMVTAQEKQVGALQEAVKALNRSVDLKETEVAIQRQRADVDAARLAFERLSPIDKIGMVAQDLADRTKEKVRRFFRRR